MKYPDSIIFESSIETTNQLENPYDTVMPAGTEFYLFYMNQLCKIICKSDMTRLQLKNGIGDWILGIRIDTCLNFGLGSLMVTSDLVDIQVHKIEKIGSTRKKNIPVYNVQLSNIY